jgi:iron complex outermembrane recepter protein
MYNRKPLVTALSIFTAMTFASWAQAQTASEPKAEKVEVTGSNIKRVAAEGATPVQVITRDQIARSGATSLSEILSTVSIGGSGSFSETNTNLSSGGGASGIGLRGLGLSYTLVLLNGRRVAPSGFGGATGVATFTDLNGIPVAAIDRVEILKGSASAIYGADAVAGVVNVILRKDFKGGETSGQVGTTQRRDATEVRADLAVGMGDVAKDKYNFMAAYSHYQRDNIRSVDRPYSKTADQTSFQPELGVDSRSLTGNPGSFRTGTVSATGVFTANSAWRAMPNCPTINKSPVTPATAEDQYCLFNFLTFWDLAPSVKRDGVTLSGNFEVSSNLSLFATALVNRNTTSFQVAPTPLTVGVIPGNAPGNSLGQAYQYRYRVTANGGRVNETGIDFSSFVAGAKGSFGAFDWDMAFNTSKTDITNKGSGYANRNLVAAAAAAGNLRPYEFAVNPALEAAFAKTIAATFTRKGIAKSDMVDAKMSGEIMQLPAGPLAVAAGFEFRKESIVDECLEADCKAGLIDGANVTGSSGKRNVNSQYIELRAPAFKGLDVTAALRRDDYSTIQKDAVTPQVAIEFRPAKEVLIRGVAGKGFKAPTLFEAYQSKSESFNSGATYADQRRCPVTKAREDCGSTQVRNFRGGNVDLKPEESKNFSLGSVIEVTKDFTVSADWYRIDLNETIGLPSVARLMAREALKGGDPLVVRGAASATDVARGLPGSIEYISLQYANLGRTIITGADAELEYRISTAEWGKFKFATSLSYTDKYWQAPEPGVALVQYAGTNDIPRFRATSGIAWSTGPVEVNYAWRHVGHHAQVYDDGSGLSTVSPENYHDLSMSYTGIKNLKLNFGIRNIMDRAPSFANGSSQAYDYSYGDPRGRSFWLSFAYKIW